MTTAFEDGIVRINANEHVTNATFEGRSHSTGDGDLLSGDVGETQLEIRAELETPAEK
ncbi:hypothetical protein [Haloterrigena sp. H1]|uniref:hypothetical protein n=1 Tax=Haloterrigena sp. H1 TaxID=2552943 RepID=UPI001BB2CE44|nr:hypothetical protein [Haloterrigena sp. H1]